MSSNNKITPISKNNYFENIEASNEQSYEDLLTYCAIRKQLSLIIPFYYIKTEKQLIKKNYKNIPNIEEYKKLKEEIKNMKQSIELLKDSKQKKINQIENLRNLMRKIGTRQITKREKKQINKIINIKVKPNFEQEKKEKKGIKNISDEGLSLTPTASGLSSGKDDDAGEDGGNQPNPYCLLTNSSNSSNNRWCFKDEEMLNNRLMDNNLERKNIMLYSN